MNTLFLATVIGWYLVIVGLLTLVQQEHVKSVMSDIMAQRGLFFVLAIITLILGLMMVASHNVWVKGWPVVITLLSWLVLIGGLIRLFGQETVNKMWHSMSNHPFGMKIVSIVSIVIGLFLLLHVYYF